MPDVLKFNELAKKFKPSTQKFKGLGLSDEFYNSRTWRKLRAIKFSTNPLCEIEGCGEPTHTVDHILPIKMGGDKLSFSNLMSLCKYHNFSKTGSQRLQGTKG